MKLSNHVVQRWAERFPHLDIRQEFALARRASKNQLRRIHASTRRPRAMLKGSISAGGRGYRVTDQGVVFVVGQNAVVITAFLLPR